MFRENQSIADKIREAIKPTPVKNRIQMAAYKLRNQTTRLDKSIARMESRDLVLHEKCVKALEARDSQTATLVAIECIQLRHLINISLNSQISTRQPVLGVQPIEHSAKILKEADLMSEQKMREKFPEIPQIPVDAHRLR